jgi:hypothetical protein
MVKQQNVRVVKVEKSELVGKLLIKKVKDSTAPAKYPRDGLFKVEWVRPPRGYSKAITRYFRTKKIAIRVSDLLNTMTRKQVISLVKTFL